MFMFNQAHNLTNGQWLARLVLCIQLPYCLTSEIDSDLKIACKNSHFRYGTICGLKKEMSIQICMQRDFSFRLRHLLADYDHFKKRNENYLVKVENAFLLSVFLKKPISHIYRENEKKCDNFSFQKFPLFSLPSNFRAGSAYTSFPSAHVSNCRSGSSVRKVRDASTRFLAVFFNWVSTLAYYASTGEYVISRCH